MAIIPLIAIACGSGGDEDDVEPIEGSSAKVRVYRDGQITLDGAGISLEGLATYLAELKQQNGIVWYYRESAEFEPHPNAMAVRQAIANENLPVTLSSKDDFSDVVVETGAARPRE